MAACQAHLRGLLFLCKLYRDICVFVTIFRRVFRGCAGEAWCRDPAIGGLLPREPRGFRPSQQHPSTLEQVCGVWGLCHLFLAKWSYRYLKVFISVTCPILDQLENGLFSNWFLHLINVPAAWTTTCISAMKLWKMLMISSFYILSFLGQGHVWCIIGSMIVCHMKVNLKTVFVLLVIPMFSVCSDTHPIQTDWLTVVVTCWQRRKTEIE